METKPGCPLDGEFKDLTPGKVRDMLVACFAAARAEIVAEGGATPDMAVLQNEAAAAVRDALRDVGGNFDDPKKEHFQPMLKVLSQRALTLGTPHNVVTRHAIRVIKALEHLP